jgi:hypothetical protein
LPDVTSRRSGREKCSGFGGQKFRPVIRIGPATGMSNWRKFHGNVDFEFIGSQVFPSRSSHDNARSSPARTKSSISRCGSRNVCGTNTGDCGFGVPAPVKSHASGGTISMSDFLLILVDRTEYIVDFLCAPFGSRLLIRSVYPLILLASP